MFKYVSDKGGGLISMEQIYDILKVYLPILLSSYPDAALDVLTKNHVMLPFTTDEIMTMIDAHSQKTHGASRTDLHVKYLEDLVIKNKYGNVYENTLLAKHYIEELIAHKRSRGSKDEVTATLKRTLITLMETNNNLDTQQLEKLIEKLDIVEVTVLEHNKNNKHEAALRTLFERWPENDKMKVCEAYCLCFGELKSALNNDIKHGPFKGFFTNLEYWIDNANQWPLKEHEIYKVGGSRLSIDKLLSHLLKIIVEHFRVDDKCVYLARDLLSKYMPFCSYKSELNCSKIIELIPDEWNFAVFANVLTQMQLKALHEERTIAMKRGLTR